MRIFQKWLFPKRNALLKLFSRRVPNSHAAHLEAFWDPPGQFSHPFSHQFSHKFHTIFTPWAGRPFEAFLGMPWGGQPSSPALRFEWISGPLLQPPGRTPGKDARGTAHHETSRAQPSTAFRLRGNLLQNVATDVVAASGTSAKMCYYRCPPE